MENPKLNGISEMFSGDDPFLYNSLDKYEFALTETNEDVVDTFKEMEVIRK